MAFDHVTMGQAFARPGMDTRQWVSYGVVDADSDGSRAVIFKDENGVSLKSGPLVQVILQPSGIPVLCRVSSTCAGNLEGEWRPLVSNDEVLVVLPEGSERAPPVIIARLNNAPDPWPTSVAGMDPQNNSFAFTRMRTAYVLEVGPSLLLRSAETNCALTFAPDGGVFLVSGDKHMLAMLGEAITLQTTNQEAMLQLDPAAKTAALYAGTAHLVVGEVDAKFEGPGTFTMVTGAVPAFQHVTSIEAVSNIISKFVGFLSGISGATGDAFAIAYAAAFAPGASTITSGILSGAAGASTDGGVQGAIDSGLGDTSKGKPGLGCKHFLVG